MKKKLAILSLIMASIAYGEEFYEGSNTVKLEESVISTSGFETSIRNTTKNVTIISNNELEEKNYSEISDVLKDVPGVTINENVFGTFIDLRGQGVEKAKSNVQILVDGVNINPLDPAHGVLPLDTVPVENIERIEVLPGGGSVLYGDGTVGGVVNIVTKTEVGKTYNVIGAKAGSFGTYEYEAAFGQKITDKLAVQVAYNKNQTDGYRDGAYSENEYFEGGINYKINDKNKVTFKYTRSEGEDSYLDSLSIEEVEKDRRQDGFNPEDGAWESADKLYLTRDTYNLNFESKLSDQLTFDLATSYQDTSNEWNSIMEGWDAARTPWPMPGNSYAVASNGTFEDKKTQISPKLRYAYGEASNLTIGIDYKDNDAARIGDPGYLGRYYEYDYQFSKETFGAYALNKTKINDFEFTGGYRREKSKYKLNRYSSEYSNAWPAPLPGTPGVNPGIPGYPYHPTPKEVTFVQDKEITNDAYELAANYLYSDTGNIYTRVEGGFRTPAPSELVDKSVDGDYTENNLKEETYNTFELGVKDFIGSSFISATVFYTETTDEIMQKPQDGGEGMPYDWMFVNLGKTERKGFELSAEQYFGKLTLKESYTFVEAKIKEGSEASNTAGNYIPGISKNSANISAKYDFTAKVNTIVSLNYKDGYYLDEANTSGEFNDYITTDLTINFMPLENLKVYAGINNLFDEKYYESAFLSSGEIMVNPAAGRSYYGGFKYTF